MNDRELLELAAKAAGFSIEYRDNGNHFASYPISQIWNPLADDGDALRLSAQLMICIHWCKAGRVYAHADGDIEACESYRGDGGAAVRRAITSAAAEIGRTMQ